MQSVTSTQAMPDAYLSQTPIIFFTSSSLTPSLTNTPIMKAIILLAALACACAIPTHHIEEEHGHHEEHHDDAHYSLGYEVHAPKTGDYKSHKETRDGDKVKGVYTVVDPDGHKRIVHYEADKHTGFHAHVTREHTDYKVPQPEHHHHEVDEHAHSYAWLSTPHHTYHH